MKLVKSSSNGDQIRNCSLYIPLQEDRNESHEMLFPVVFCAFVEFCPPALFAKEL